MTGQMIVHGAEPLSRKVPANLPGRVENIDFDILMYGEATKSSTYFGKTNVTGYYKKDGIQYINNSQGCHIENPRPEEYLDLGEDNKVMQDIVIDELIKYEDPFVKAGWPPIDYEDGKSVTIYPSSLIYGEPGSKARKLQTWPTAMEETEKGYRPKWFRKKGKRVA